MHNSWLISGSSPVGITGRKKRITLMIKAIVANLQRQLADRRRYRRAIAEIDSMTPRDFADLRADPIEMYRHAWIEVYGDRAA